MPGGASASEIAETIGRQIRYVLPEDSIVPSSINSGVPATIFKPKSRYAVAVKQIVVDLMKDEAIMPERERRFGLLGIGR
jgi:MinD-like ATPase involved in chromosome partitioning or flagellar assembly